MPQESRGPYQMPYEQSRVLDGVISIATLVLRLNHLSFEI